VRNEHAVHTLNNNARALLALCMHYDLTDDKNDLVHIHKYFDFVRHCLQPEGYFLNYTDSKGSFTELNNFTNLADANGRAIWALGYLVSLHHKLPVDLVTNAESIMQKVLSKVNTLHSTRAIAFIIKGLYYYHKVKQSPESLSLIHVLADKLVQLYKHESERGWEWFERYLAYNNSVLPNALLCASLATGNRTYADIARTSFRFLLAQYITDDGIQLRREYLPGREEEAQPAEPSLEVCYIILALGDFYEAYREDTYLKNMEKSFAWFLGDNAERREFYHSESGACYSTGSGAELEASACSTLAYLLSRLTLERHSRAGVLHASRGASRPNEINKDGAQQYLA
jgi:uncharacterized protein YyaL (SSP411 family)